MSNRFDQKVFTVEFLLYSSKYQPLIDKVKKYKHILKARTKAFIK
jgi:hypothetical protein